MTRSPDSLIPFGPGQPASEKRDDKAFNRRQEGEANRHRDQLDQRAQDLLAYNLDFQRLKTLPGVGAITALTILAEVGDLRRFRHHRQFLKYCGLDLAKSQSGQNKGHEVLSKRGNKRLRLAFWMAGLVTIHQRENVFRDKYERYLRATPFDADRKRRALLPALFRTTNSQWIDPSRSSR